MLFFFFFQAEDGIRDLTVTGVQTCALPIYFISTQRRDTRAHSSRPASISSYRPSSERCSARPNRLRKSASSRDRKSTRLNSSHSQISYAVFCLKKKKKKLTIDSVCMKE